MQKLKMLTMVAFFTLGTAAIGQNKVTDKALIGTWKMTINSESVMKEIKKEADKEDNLFAKVILNSVGGLVDGVIRNLDIYMTFERDGDAKILIDAFEESSQEEDSDWYIKNGKLFIRDIKKGDNIDWDSNDYWVMKDGVLYLETDEEVEVYMVKMDRK